jgi:predicted MFS family arabinose efflux permease
MGRNAAERGVSFRDVLTVMRDHRVWLGGLMYFGLIVPAYGYAYFAPTIIQSYHYSAIQTQLRSVPPWVAAFAFSMLVAVLSDWCRHRFLFAIGPICISIAGFAILLNVHDHVNVQYAALFLICMGTYSAMPVIVCWFNMNLGGHHRRAIGTAWQIGMLQTPTTAPPKEALARFVPMPP